MIVQIIVRKLAYHKNKGNDISNLNTVKITDKKRRFDRSSVIFK